MQTGRLLFWNSVALAGLCGLAGCGASVGRETDATADRAASAETDVLPPAGQHEYDALYGAEPLVPAIRLSGDDPVATQPAVVQSIFPVSASGILSPDFTADRRAAFHPHGSQVCASGCAASNHATPELTRAKFHHLLTEYQRGPLDETNTALETLLFYGRQSAALLDSTAASSLDAQHPQYSQYAQFLRRELKQTHALLSFRIVDEQGVVRVKMRQTRVPLDRRHVFNMDSTDLPPLVTSGTVKRVGLHHLWTRL